MVDDKFLNMKIFTLVTAKISTGNVEPGTFDQLIFLFYNNKN